MKLNTRVIAYIILKKVKINFDQLINYHNKNNCSKIPFKIEIAYYLYYVLLHLFFVLYICLNSKC